MTTENGEQREQEVAWTDLKAADMQAWVKGTTVENPVAWRYSHHLNFQQESTKRSVLIPTDVPNEVNKQLWLANGTV